ncbi:hypothetical protein DT075_35465 [Bacillus licheniformis]|nr:hypothetical protein DT075_35465 [Bacillus licheniformis]
MENSHLGSLTTERRNERSKRIHQAETIDMLKIMNDNIYDGSFSSKKIAGNGLTSALLKKEGFRVISEHQIDEL